MLGKTHLAAGFCAGTTVAAAHFLSPANSLIVIGGCMLGSLLPDIDQKNSMISQAAKPVGVVVSAVAGHRKLLHDPALYVLAMAAARLLVPQVFLWLIPVFIGVTTHLLLDTLNPMGIPLLYVFQHGKWKLCLAKIRTGSWFDSFLCGALWAVGYGMLAKQILQMLV